MVCLFTLTYVTGRCCCANKGWREGECVGEGGGLKESERGERKEV